VEDWFPGANNTGNMTARINIHLGAEVVMTLGEIQDPEGAKTMVMSLKTVAGATLAVQRETYKITYFRDAASGKLIVDPDATAGGKQNPTLQGHRVFLIYMKNMHTEDTLNLERCAHKIYAKTRIN
jgi:hypothetical protein